MNKNLLVADNDDAILSALSMLLKAEGFVPECCTSPAQVLSRVKERDFGLVLIDLNYSLDTTSGEEGLNLISTIRKIDELIPIVVMTGWGTIEVAVKAMQMGANDFIQKPWDNDRLLTIIENQLSLADLKQNSQRLAQQNQLLEEEANPPVELIGESPDIQKILDILKQLAKTNAALLITGENGTGKSMFARYFHKISARRDSSFIGINMGSVTDSLFESEMFGHVKGAFTDAKTSRIGRFELADGGTLFLDEIGNTPLSQQSKLLRVLEDQEFEKVGSSKTQKVNVQLIAATNCDLNQAVENGAFRKDLFYRINTVHVEIPPLRKRTADIIPLAENFLLQLSKKYGGPCKTITNSAKKLLMEYGWPGNVRELSHVMERAQILSDINSIDARDLGLNMGAIPLDLLESRPSDVELKSLDDIEQEVIEKRIAYFEGDGLQAAKSLGLSRSAFYRRLGKGKKTRHRLPEFPND